MVKIAKNMPLCLIKMGARKDWIVSPHHSSSPKKKEYKMCQSASLDNKVLAILLLLGAIINKLKIYMFYIL